ncbi:MAG: FtsW/RodA/SpoVE family cell cycle protein [Lentisphaeria bacterium]
MQKTRSVLLILVGLLIVFGLVMLYSTSYPTAGFGLLKMQAMWIILACGCGYAMRQLDYHGLCRHSLFILAFFVLALAYLALAHGVYRVAPAIGSAFPFTGGVKGAFRWFKLGPVRLQPSEFTKLGLILFLAHYYGKNSLHIREAWRGFFLPLGIAGFVTSLVLLGGSLSVTAITGATVGCMAFIAGVRLRYLALCLLAGILVGAAAIAVSPERFSRITSFTSAEELQQGEGYQLWHSLLALGSGGLTGLGFTESRMKKYYLPESHTDFIVAIVGEELGYLAVASLICLYLLLALTVLRIAGQAADREGSLICTGVAASLGFNAFVNIGVVSGLLPTTGVTAPFLSYGGSSILASGIGLGLVLSVSRHAEQAAALRQAQEAVQAVARPTPLRKLFA